MKNLFMDTNIWLSLYTLSDDNLAQFGKLEEMIGKSVNLIVTQQVRDELVRNREGKLKEALDVFQFKGPLYPVFTQGYEEYSTISQSIKEAAKQFNAWKSKIQTDIKSFSLPADHTIEKLFKKVTILPCDSYVDTAYLRYRIGNPPGKDNKYGDAINWECLLSSIPNGEDLFFISSDQDYRSTLESNDMNPFLIDEWSTKKQSSIHFYTRLVHFLNEHIKEIEIQSENEKNQLISQLLQSYNFNQTHYLISLLSNYSNWTKAQIETLCSAFMTNNQVYWIREDQDVDSFFTEILSKIDYSTLEDGYTKQAWEVYFLTPEEIAREDAKADEADTLEEYYRQSSS